MSRSVSFVTGAAQGIGRGIALRLARDGFDVAVNDLPSKAALLEELVREIKGINGRRSIALCGDVSSDQDVSSMIEKVVAELGSLNVMVSNAGIFDSGTLVTTSLETWQRVMTINAQSAFLCIKHAANAMIKQGKGGRIILASSLAGKQGAASAGPYCASKFAVRGLAQVAACELKPHGITVNAYAPGYISTAMLDDVMTRFGLSRDQLPTQGAPDDIANLVSFWANEKSGFVTGQTWAIDGGTYFD